MFRRHGLILEGTLLTLATVLLGCNTSPSNSGPPKKETPAGSQTKEAPAGSQTKEAAQDKPANEDVRQALAELPEAERAVAERQRVCPVTGELLGSMGKPYKVTVKDQTFYLCCSGCEDELKKDPDKFLAKLKPAEKPAEDE